MHFSNYAPMFHILSFLWGFFVYLKLTDAWRFAFLFCCYTDNKENCYCEEVRKIIIIEENIVCMYIYEKLRYIALDSKFKIKS